MSESTQSTSNMGDNGDSRGACDENGDNSVPTDVGSFAGVESGRVPVPNGRHASEQSDGDAALDDVENASRLQLEYEGVDEGGDVDVDGLVDEFGWMDTGDGVAAYHGPLTSRIVVDGLEGDAGDHGLKLHSHGTDEDGEALLGDATPALAKQDTPNSTVSNKVFSSGMGGVPGTAVTSTSTSKTDDALLHSEESKKLVKWVEYFIRQHGGRVIGANLGSALASSNGAMYRAIKGKFGGLTSLLSKFPEYFVLENDPPFNHVSLTDSHYAAAYKLMVLQAGMNKQQGTSEAAKKTPEELEREFVRHTAAILNPAPGKSLKAVELANILRARMGTDALAIIRESHGGLLSLLEKHEDVFRVERIPKNDSVVLVASDDMIESLKLEELSGNGENGQAGPGENWSSSLAIPSRCLHVGNVSVSMTEEKLRQQFGMYGTIESLKMVTAKGRRFAFVNYATVAEAEAVKAALSKMHTWRSNISFAKRETISLGMKTDSGEFGGDGTGGKARNLNPSRHLWVGSLPNVSKSTLHTIFSEFGEIEDIHFLKDRRCAFVDFKNEEDCIMAYRMMNHRKIGDSTIELGFGRPRDSPELSGQYSGWQAPDSAYSDGKPHSSAAVRSGGGPRSPPIMVPPPLPSTGQYHYAPRGPTVIQQQGPTHPMGRFGSSPHQVAPRPMFYYHDTQAGMRSSPSVPPPHYPRGVENGVGLARPMYHGTTATPPPHREFTGGPTTTVEHSSPSPWHHHTPPPQTFMPPPPPGHYMPVPLPGTMPRGPFPRHHTPYGGMEHASGYDARMAGSPSTLPPTFTHHPPGSVYHHGTSSPRPPLQQWSGSPQVPHQFA